MENRLTVDTSVESIEDKEKENGFKDWSCKTIIIAEDEEVNFVYLQTALSLTKVNILRAKNGEEAVQLALNNEHVDLILMDIKMPIMNGLEATRAIKNQRSELIVIAQTAFAQEEDKSNCFAVGVDDFIEKPVRYKLLFSILEKYLN